jgi:hypothetical protein
MRSWVRWSAVLCLSLMLWTVAAESTHNHPIQSSQALCAICLAAHTASPAASSMDATPAFSAVGFLCEEAVDVYVRLDFSDLGNRGPPAV